jgi:hypothetical protein
MRFVSPVLLLLALYLLAVPIAVRYVGHVERDSLLLKLSTSITHTHKHTQSPLLAFLLSDTSFAIHL